MADRYDSRFPGRPPSGPGTTPGRDGQAGADDPLVELARIVSGRSAAPPSGRPEKPVAPASPPKPAAATGYEPLPSEADLARDLESELLNELQATFSSIPEIVGRPQAPQPKAPPPQRPPEPPPASATDFDFQLPDLSVEFPEVPEPQPEMSFRPPFAESRPEGVARETQHKQPQAFPQPRPVQPHAGGPQPSRDDAQIRPAGIRRESLATRIAQAARSGEQSEQGAAQRQEQPEAQRIPAPKPRPPAGRLRNATGRPDAGNVPLRPTLAPNAPPVPATNSPRQATRWDPEPAPENHRPLDPARFSPHRIANARPDARDAYAPAALPDLPSDADFFAEQQPITDDAFFDELQANENYEAVPGYSDEEMVPYPEDDLSAYEPRRSRRGPVAIAALLVIAVIGGAAVVMLRSGATDGIPPIISADSSPTKVAPDSTGTGESDAQGKLIYDRVDPGTEVADSQLVVNGDQPIADIPPSSDDTTSEVSRVILGGGPGFDEGGESDPDAPIDLTNGAETTVAAGEGTISEPIGPKKVRTVVVRPDGTIVSSEAIAPGGEATASEGDETIAELPPASETPPAPAADENPLLSDNFGVETVDRPAPESPTRDNPIANPAAESVPDIRPPASAATTAPAPQTAPAASPTIVATTGDTSGPIDVTPRSSPPSQQSGGSGNFMVQVSSQRSEEVALATFQELQRRYPSLLGNRQPNIQRADLGERGVYYRVRVGYPTRDQAVGMCENLKAAGGDCLLATR